MLSTNDAVKAIVQAGVLFDYGGSLFKQADTIPVTGACIFYTAARCSSLIADAIPEIVHALVGVCHQSAVFAGADTIMAICFRGTVDDSRLITVP